VFRLFGRWCQLHYHWRERLPALAQILSHPAPIEGDWAIIRQHADAVAEIREIRAQCAAWGTRLETELAKNHPAYADCARGFCDCHHSYAAWIARLDPPGSLTPDALTLPLQEADAQRQDLWFKLIDRLDERHPLPRNHGGLALTLFIGAFVVGIAFYSFYLLMLGLGLAFLIAKIEDALSGRRKAVARQNHFKGLIEHP
jgi:hypothetical protein